VISIAAGCAGVHVFASKADVSAVNGLREQLVVAANAGNAEAVTALFAEDAVLMPPGTLPLAGRQAIGRWWTRAAAEAPSSSTEVDSFEVVVMEEWAFDRGVYATVVDAGSEAERRVHGNYLHVLRRQADGTWKIARAMWNHLPSLIVEDVPRLPR
jgi:uncharacterized protein (TIGR02246 family)